MDLVSLIPVLVAIIAGGGVALYTARPQKDSIIAAASEKAVNVVTQAIARLEAENDELRERVVALEAEVRRAAADSVLAAATARSSERRILALRRELERLGGDGDRINKESK